MAERTNAELADALEQEVASREHTYEGTNTELLYEAAARLRSMPEGERIEGYIIGRTLMVNDWEHITIRTGDSTEKGREPAVIFIQHRKGKSDKPTHVCGLHGFDSMKGDVCPKCEQEQSLREGKGDE